tara:strand:+ start:10934 stop:12364 length:1431 start_codon:yes stop_codon:yes gene_type:complete
MKILFINPPSENEKVWVREGRCQQFDIWGAPFPPLTLAYLKTQIKDISKALVLDPGPARMSHTETFKAIKDFQPDLMIMSVTTPTFNNDCNWFAKKVKQMIPKIVIGAVGIHVMALPQESLQNAGSLDFVFISEAEAVIKGVVQSLASGSLVGVEGVAYKNRQGKVVINNRVAFSGNIDDYGFPDWGDIDFDNYRLPVKNRPFSLISFSRGCPYACTFCAAKTYYGQRLRKRSIKKIIEEIDYNLELGVKDFLFWTELISADRAYLEEFLDTLMSQGLDQKIDWVCNSRVDQLDPELFAKMKKAGCWQIAFGLEFGTDKMLKKVNKGGQATIEVGRRAVNQADKAGLVVDGHFIMGYPGETLADMEQTIRFAVSLPLTFAHFYLAAPFPGSALYGQIKGNFQSADLWNKISQDQHVLSGSGYSESDVKIKISRAYKKFYLSLSRVYKISKAAKGIKEKINLIKTGMVFILDILKIK